MDLKKKRRGGFYWVEDRPYISVTKILSVIDKPALRYWFGKEVYLAMTIDPSLSQREALAAPYRTSKKAMSRGTTVHSIVEAWKNIDEVVGKEGPFRGYAEAFQSWLKDHSVQVLECEKTVVNEEHGYAGTLDLRVLINEDEHATIVDVKTGKDLYPEVHFQLSAYKEGLDEEGVETAALLLREDGTYKYETGRDKFRGFLACKALYEELNSDMLYKVGYFKEEKCHD